VIVLVITGLTSTNTSQGSHVELASCICSTQTVFVIILKTIALAGLQIIVVLCGDKLGTGHQNPLPAFVVGAIQASPHTMDSTLDTKLMAQEM
jgi:hypothetical protein